MNTEFLNNIEFDQGMILYLALGIVLAAILFGIGVLLRRKTYLNRKYFKKRWQEIVKLASERVTWQQSVIEADKLVDAALKRRLFKGATMGERLVSAARHFTNQDALWRAHKLRNKIAHEDGFKAKRADIKAALEAFRTALKDLGAL